MSLASTTKKVGNSEAVPTKVPTVGVTTEIHYA